VTILLQDDFTGNDGDAPDVTKWVETDGESLLSIQNNKLDFDAVNVESLITAYIVSIGELSGVFSATIDWEEISYNQNLHEATLKLELIFTDGHWAAIYKYYDGAGGEGYYVGSDIDSFIGIGNYDTSGKFKIARDGNNNIRLWYWSGAQWEWDGDTDGYLLTLLTTNSDCTVRISVVSGGDPKSPGIFHTTIDNFIGSHEESIMAAMAATDRLTFVLNMRNSAPFQWVNFDFNSMTMFNGVPIGANEDGIFSLFDADDDNGTDIDAFFELVKTDLGTSESKKIRFYYFTGETSGDLKIKLQVDDGEERTFLVPAKKIGQLQHRLHRVDGRNDLRGVYWRPRIENTKGCDFSVDAIDILLSLLGNR